MSFQSKLKISLNQYENCIFLIHKKLNLNNHTTWNNFFNQNTYNLKKCGIESKCVCVCYSMVRSNIAIASPSVKLTRKHIM